MRLVAQDAARKQVRIRRENGSPLPLAMADLPSLQQVILNLVFNAMDAMDETPDALRWLVIESRPHGPSGVEVSIRDHGAGFPAGRLLHAFDAFFTTKEDGTGLGMAIAQSIIEAHQGRIYASNNDDGGATVRLRCRARRRGNGPQAAYGGERTEALRADQVTGHAAPGCASERPANGRPEPGVVALVPRLAVMS